MTYEDDGLTTEAFEKIISKLPPEEAEKLRQDRKVTMESARIGAFASIWAQNFSHGVEKHALLAFPSSDGDSEDS